MSILRRLGAVLGVVIALVVVGGVSATPAGAHAILVSSTPGDGARLDDAPASVELEFSEPISVDLGGLRVLDADGERVDRGAVRAVDRTISVDVADGLPDGAYVATYRIVSADGHPVRGGIVFTVGDTDADAAGLARLLDDDGERSWELVGAASRWLAMVGALVVVGGVGFVAWCRPERARRFDIALRAGAVAGIVGAVANVWVQAALATGRGAGALFDDGVLRSVLADGYGASVTLAVVGLTVAVFVWRRRWLAVLGSIAVVASFPLVGHTRFDDVAIGTVSDVVHVGAAGIWAGGLLFLLLALGTTTDPATRARMVGRFSTVATVAIVVVAGAGVALSWVEVKALSALTSTTYGWVLVTKVAMVAVVAAVGAYNHFRVVPTIEASPQDPAPRRRLRATLLAELAGLVVIAAVTAVLVNETPAYVDAGIGQIHSEILDLGDAGSVQLVVDPNRAGENSLHLYFYDPEGRPAEIAEDVLIRLSKPGDDIGPIDRTPFRAGPAHFQWDGSELVSGGRWTVTVVARIDRFSEETATADVLVGS